MSFLAPYTTWDNGTVSFTRAQASRFAKQVADDYNPIHDINAKRFCVPGDLLFAVLLTRQGLYPRMEFTFAGMVGDGVPLHFSETEAGELKVVDEKGREYLSANFSGSPNRDPEVIESTIRSYVRFSGHNFPHVLGGLMEKHGVMINSERPLVIYESMALHLNSSEVHNLVIEPSGADMEVVGKRGNVHLRFRFLEEGTEVGTGEKRMVLSGLRDYDPAVMEEMVARYDRRKAEGVE